VFVGAAAFATAVPPLGDRTVTMTGLGSGATSFAFSAFSAGVEGGMLSAGALPSIVVSLRALSAVAASTVMMVEVGSGIGTLSEGALCATALSVGVITVLSFLTAGALSVGTLSVGTLSVGTLSVGALSVGATSVGALSVGTLSEGELSEGRGVVALAAGTLSVGALVVSVGVLVVSSSSVPFSFAYFIGSE
jgi:hypothetical protein